MDLVEAQLSPPESSCSNVIMEECDKISKSNCAWKHRRSRSTSNLISVVHGRRSDSEGTEGNESDDAQRSFAKLSLQNVRSGNFLIGKSHNLPPKNHNEIESDSVNELFGTMNSNNPKSSEQTSKRRRRYKRMAVESVDSPPIVRNLRSEESVFKEPHPHQLSSLNVNLVTPSYFTLNSPITNTSSITNHNSQGHPKKHRKKSVPSTQFPPYDPESGKRKRSSGPNASTSSQPLHYLDFESSNSPNSTTTSPTTNINLDEESSIRLGGFRRMMRIGMGLICDNVPSSQMDEEMKSEGESSLSSLSPSSHINSGDEGQEGDDEQSDWVGDEWRSEEYGNIVNTDHELLVRRTREIRAGRRRVHPQKPLFSTPTFANETVAKFLQDPQQSQIKLHPMRKDDERVQLTQIASLYSLQLHSDESSGLPCPVLTKTPATMQVDFSSKRGDGSGGASNYDKIATQNDTKRFKK